MPGFDPFSDPPRTFDGFAVWRVKVAPNEHTCTACGETFAHGDMCPRCGYGEKGEFRGNPPPAVPSLSYLKDNEFELIK